uniref:Uncharacterized protein n=1 Tax=Avena sativa TaxID=4498 RepID=A0ACD5UI59_AVESA
MAYGGGMSAVDAILAEAADLVALEQIARLNTAHLDDSAALPSSLESRFRKLKSLPTAAPAPPQPVKALARSVTAPPQRREDPPAADPPPQANPPAPAPEEAHMEKQSPPPPPQPQTYPPKTAVPAVREEDEEEEEDLERLFGPRRGRPTLKERNRRSHDDSPSPQRLACCFPFSPKKTPATRRSSKTHAGGDRDDDDDVLGISTGEWGDENKRIVTGLKEEQRRLKKALEEQVKVSRETAKMARWVKQASARMTHTDAIDDLLSDLDDDDVELK